MNSPASTIEVFTLPSTRKGVERDDSSAQAKQTVESNLNASNESDSPGAQDGKEDTKRAQVGSQLEAVPEESTSSMKHFAIESEPESEGGVQAWLVVIGSCLSFFVTLGLVYSFGVLQSALLQRGIAR